MSRKPWTPEEDRVLIILKDQKKQKKWSSIALKMEDEFNIIGRTGKQCRQRYHNHLGVQENKEEWTEEEEKLLFSLHQLIGSKWAIISSKLPGRTDNSVKNHYYSKLRKALRKLNRNLRKHLKKQYTLFKNEQLYKIIQTINSLSAEISEESINHCKMIIKNLIAYENMEDEDQQNGNILKTIAEMIKIFVEDPDNKAIKKKNKAKYDDQIMHLHPNSCLKALIANKDELSQDVSSNLDSSSAFSSDIDGSSDYGSTLALKRTQSQKSETSSGKAKKILTRSMEIGRAIQYEEPIHQVNLSERSKSSSNSFQEKNKTKLINLFYQDSPFMMRIISPKIADEDRFQFTDKLFCQNDEIEEKMEVEEVDQQLKSKMEEEQENMSH